MLVPFVQRCSSIPVAKERNMITHMPTANTTDIICMMTTTLPTFLPMRVCFPSGLFFENSIFFIVAYSVCLSELKIGIPPLG